MGAGRRADGRRVRRIYFCPFAWSPLSAVTVMSGLSFRKLFSPMPLTFINSSIFLKLPFFCRYSTMRCAELAPTPGSVCSCAADAELRLTGLAAVARALELAVARALELAVARGLEPPLLFAAWA